MKVFQPYLEQKDSSKPKRACLFTSGKEERGTRKGNQKLKMGWKQRKGMYYRAGYTVGSHFHFHLPVPWLSNLQGLSPLRSKDISQVDLSLLGIGHFVPWESEVFSACSVCHEMLRRSRADTTAVKAWHQNPRTKSHWHPGRPLLSDVIDFTMLQAKRFWRETVSLLEVMWPRGNQWERALFAKKIPAIWQYDITTC